MNQYIYFECNSGISGDMTLGALLDAGVDLKALRKELRRLPIKGWRLEAEEIKRGGIAGTHAKVLLAKNVKHGHRHYSHIRAMLEETPLPGKSAEMAINAFTLLGRAEAAAHKTTIEKVHFHEVGAIDAIIDITGAMIGLEMLGAQKFGASTVTVGSGETQCAHGTLPVPAPATARILTGAPVQSGPTAKEMTTPTGAAILMSLKPQFGPVPAMRLEKAAYGAGTREIPDRPNYLRLLCGQPLGTAEAGNLKTDRLCLLTTEIDDMSPEFYAPMMERLFKAGCRDAYLAPITMKKGRPAVSIKALADEAKRGEIIETLLRHSSTFGVKSIPVERHCLRRKSARVSTTFGTIRVKIGYWGEEALKAVPEYEDCRRLAEKADIAIGTVYNEALQAIGREIKIAK